MERQHVAFIERISAVAVEVYRHAAVLIGIHPASARKGAANAAERSAVNIKIPGGNSISSAEGWFACFPFAKQISGINLPRRGRRPKGG